MRRMQRLSSLALMALLLLLLPSACQSWTAPRISSSSRSESRTASSTIRATATRGKPSSTTLLYVSSSDVAQEDDTTQQQQQQEQEKQQALADEAFLNDGTCQRLCKERNLPLDKVKNARDLASVVSTNANAKGANPIRPNRVYRMGRLGDATPADLDVLFRSTNSKEKNKSVVVAPLRTIVDLRSPTELKDDPALMREDVFEGFTDLVWKERANRGKGCLRELPKGTGPVISRACSGANNEEEKNKQHQEQQQPRRRKRDILFRSMRRTPYVDRNSLEVELLDEDVHEAPDAHQDATVNIVSDDDCLACDDSSDSTTNNNNNQRKERHFVSLMNEFKYVKGTVSKVRKRDITKSLLKSPAAVLSKRVRDSCKKPFLDEINGGGLTMLNELLLQYGAPGIRYVLELCSDRNRHPVAFHCTAGKDRTGIIAVIILALCGVPDEAIVEDYAMSANVYAEMNDHKAMVGALSQRSLDPKVFLGAHPQVMREVLANIRQEFGSVEGYCTWIGFGPEKQQKLREALMEE